MSDWRDVLAAARAIQDDADRLGMGRTTPLTDAELERKVAEAMGWKLHEVSIFGKRKPLADAWKDEKDTIICYVREWHPLEVDENGQPTERAKAQAWAVLEWLRVRPMYITVDNSGVSVATLEAGGWPVIDEYKADSLARAVLLAAVAVGNEAI